MPHKKRKILITSALPYANSDLHLGSMLEHLLTDIWSRFQRSVGNTCVTICADDTHGAPIMIEARNKGITAEQLIEEVKLRHIRDLKAFGVEYDEYGSTNSKANYDLCQQMFETLEKQGPLTNKVITQLYCTNENMFLPDRFVKGTCPKCDAVDQYGDNCDKCGAVYQPSEMKNPRCAKCSSIPEPRQSEHVFFVLEKHREFLAKWVPEHTHESVAQKLNEWFQQPFHDWCLTRDAPYFGFEVKNRPTKYFYVWFDAPMGYISTTQEYCAKHEGKYQVPIWDPKSEWEIYHNIGKDIVYFHALFWPAVLKSCGFKGPEEIFVHGMLTVNGEKMSKSKGTSIQACTFAKHLDPEYLRYYFACKITDNITDMDLNFDDFVSRVNSDLIGKITNIASRGAQMLGKNFALKLSLPDEDGEKLLSELQNKSTAIQRLFDSRQFAKAMVEIRQLADELNKYFDERTPWKLVKENPEATQKVLTTILNGFRILAIYLSPVMPNYSERSFELFGEKDLKWADVKNLKTNTTIQEFKPLMSRIQETNLQNIITESMPKTMEPTPPISTSTRPIASLLPEIDIDTFAKSDLRLAKVLECEAVVESDKLLKFKLDLGPLGQRQIFSGIKKAFTNPSELIGKYVVVVANLKPRKMKFGMSEGMIVSVSKSDSETYLVTANEKAEPGMRLE